MKFEMNRKFYSVLALAMILGVGFGRDGVAASKVSSITFQVAGGNSEIEIKTDHKIDFEKQENGRDKQIILDLKDSELQTNASRKLDTSSFNSRVSLISPYQVDAVSQGKNARIVIQLRDMASATVLQTDNSIRITIPNTGDSGTAPTTSENDKVPAESAANASASSAAAAPAASDAKPSPAETPKSTLEQFVASQGGQKFSGRPISFQVRDADLVDVFRLIGETSGFNIVVGDDVKGKITLALTDVPWDQALDLVLHTQHLGAERNNNVLRISTLASLTSEKQLEYSAKKAAESTAPRVTRVFPISYADLNDLSLTLTKFAVDPSAPVSAGGAAGAGGAASSSSSSSVVQADKRTNSIIVRDLPDNIDRMKKLIEILDTQTPQVLIEAKIVEASESFSRGVGGKLGGGIFGNNNAAGASFSGGDAGNVLSPGTLLSSVGAGNLGITQTLAFLPGTTRLNAFLSLSEAENHTKTLASPKTVVMNKETATITQSTPTLTQQQVSTPGGTTTTFVNTPANLSLTVTPTITNDGSVLMTLNMNRDIVTTSNGQPAVAARNMTTKVLVESGTTLVIGGIYTNSTIRDETGFPWLRKIPLLGALFGNDNMQDQKSELFFFITPRILNEKEAGLTAAMTP